SCLIIDCFMREERSLFSSSVCRMGPNTRMQHDRFAREKLAILECGTKRSRRLMRRPVGRAKLFSLMGISTKGLSRKCVKGGNRTMGLGDLYSDTASDLGAGLEWYALPRGGERDTEGHRSIDDGRMVFALLHALRIQDDAFGTELEPLIAAALAGELQPL